MSRPTIRDVARHAGVSAGTVSRALRGYPDVAPETRAAVRAVAAALGYEPAAAARTVRLGRSGLVGAFLSACPDDAGNLQPFGRLVIAGLAQRLSTSDIALLDFENVDDLVAHATARQLDAAVLVAISDDALAAARPDAAPCPLIGVDTACPIEVRTDHALGIEMVVDHLTALGHRRIGFAGAQPSTVAGRERLRGFRQAMAARGLRVDRTLVHEGDFSQEAGRAAADALLSCDPPPSAIVTVSDMVAAGVLATAAQRGLRVPDDLSVTGFDDVHVAQVLSPPLTTVRHDPARLGALAADTACALIDGDRPQSVVVAPTLTVRASAAPPRYAAAAATG